MKRQKDNRGEQYINSFPKFRKWINECLCCHEKGYDPSMPNRINAVEGSLGAYFIKKYFKPLPLNQDGLCETCERIINNKK